MSRLLRELLLAVLLLVAVHEGEWSLVEREIDLYHFTLVYHDRAGRLVR